MSPQGWSQFATTIHSSHEADQAECHARHPDNASESSWAPNLGITLALQIVEVGKVQCVENIGLALPGCDKMHVIIHRAATNTVGTSLVECSGDIIGIEHDHGCAARFASTRKPSEPPVSVAKVSFNAWT